MNDAIREIHAREVLDSRGHPTVEAEVVCADGSLGRAIAPSGASTGIHEALELRDGDPTRYGGKGVRNAVGHVRGEIAPLLAGRPAGDQSGNDAAMIALDGTANKSRLGANAILAVSLAIAHAAANSRRIPLWQYLDGESRAALPMPMVNLISGGKHAGGNLDFQDFLFVPIAARSLSEALEMTVAVYRALARLLVEQGFEGVLVGDEGGFGPRLPENERAVELICSAFGRVGLRPGSDAAIAVDVASSHFFRNNRYHLRGPSGGELTSDEFADVLGSWVGAYPIVSIEDGLAEDDWDGWIRLSKLVGARVQLIGDDLFATNARRLRKGIDRNVANAVLVKVNQVGTLTETLDVVRMAWTAGYRTIVSARSGETEDSTIADLAVGLNAGQIKIGSIVRSERLAKYNQLLRIEESLPRFRTWASIVNGA